MIPISWIVFQKLLQDTLVNIRSKILGKIDLKNAITLCRLTSVFHTSYSSVYVSFSSDKVNSFINTSFSARWLFLIHIQKDSNVPQISTGFLYGYLAHRQYAAPPPPQHGCILSPTWLYTTLPPKNKTKNKKNMVDKSLWLNCECLFQKPVDTDYVSGMKNNGCLLKEAHQESWFIDVMID